MMNFINYILCSWTHGGGTVKYNPNDLIDWQCRKCGRWCGYKEKS